MMAPPHPACTFTVGLWLLALLYSPSAQQTTSPCGPDTLIAYIDEYPNILGYVRLSGNDAYKYTYQKLIDVSIGGGTITVVIDENNRPPAIIQSLAVSQILRVEQRLDNRGYDLVMLIGLDRDGASYLPDDDINSLQFRLECRPAGSTSTYYHVLKIQLQDVNDNAPQFQSLPYSTTINELTPVGLTVYSRTSVTDLDNQNNKLVGFSIAMARGSVFNGNGVFVIPELTTGVVTLAQPLDYEAMAKISSQTSFLMNITATDFGNRNLYPYNYSQSSWTQLNITVVDGDDLGPYFVYSSCPSSPFKACVRPQYTSSIPTGTTTPLGSSLTFLPVPRLTNPALAVDMLMRDGDTLNAPVNCSVAYSIPAGYHGYFTTSSQIVPGTNPNQYRCLIRVTNPFNRTNIQSLDLVVLATEQTPNAYTEEAVVSLEITPRNLYPPQLVSSSGQFEGFILDSAVAGEAVKNDSNMTGVLRLSITDRDLVSSDRSPAYDITLQPALPFAVDPLGFLYLRRAPLDRDTNPQYNLQVTVQERETSERRNSTQLLKVTVLKAPKNCIQGNGSRVPAVPSDLYRVKIAEGDYSVGSGEFLLDVHATDPASGTDEGLTYSVLTVDPPVSATFFQLLPQGFLLLKGRVTAGQLYTVILQVAIGGGSSSMTTRVVVILTVGDSTFQRAPC